MRKGQTLLSLFTACAIAGFCVFLVVGLAGCGGGGGGGGSSTVNTLGYTLTGKVVLPDGSSGPNILVMASRVEENSISRKQAKVQAAGPDDRRDFVNTLQTIKNDQSDTYATTTDADGVYMLNGLKEGDYFIEASRDGHHLDAVAGREQRCLLHFVLRDELLEERRGFVHGQLLAELERRTAVVHAEQQDLHTSSSTPMTARLMPSTFARILAPSTTVSGCSSMSL